MRKSLNCSASGNLNIHFQLFGSCCNHKTARILERKFLLVVSIKLLNIHKDKDCEHSSALVKTLVGLDVVPGFKSSVFFIKSSVKADTSPWILKLNFPHLGNLKQNHLEHSS